ncbi:hypothetical protein F5884DRAFT_796634 [Xylogone sp. PMI_703]|nr:hypothetical protein F5884DRAFT_796634 [Xylogone sp. PMI_703]
MSLPTRLKISIRDLVTSPSSTLQSRFSNLQTTLGHPVGLDAEWSMLWTSLSEAIPDQSTFVPLVVQIVTSWVDAFEGWLDEEQREEQVGRCLDSLKGARGLKIILEVSTSPSSRPTTTWSSRKSSFIIYLPKSRPPSQQTSLAGFTSDLLPQFASSSATSPVIPATKSAAPVNDDPDSWADLGLDTTIPSRTLPHRGGPGESARPNGHDLEPEALPDLATIARPEELLSRPPYRLIVRQQVSSIVEVQGSHQESLMLLEKYLKRWVRHSVTLVNKPPLVSVTLKESVFGLGLLYDSLIIEGFRDMQVNSMLVLTFVENVLGYTMLRGRDGAGSVWEFERKRGFR